jgi:hypothetical protein
MVILGLSICLLVFSFTSPIVTNFDPSDDELCDLLELDLVIIK